MATLNPGLIGDAMYDDARKGINHRVGIAIRVPNALLGVQPGVKTHNFPKPSRGWLTKR